MNGAPGFLDAVGGVLTMISETFWQGVGALFDGLRLVTGGTAFATILTMVALLVGAAFLMQLLLRGRLKASRLAGTCIWRLEQDISVFGWVFRLIALPFWTLAWIVRGFWFLFDWTSFRRFMARRIAVKERAERAKDLSLRVAMLGPSFGLGAIITAGLFIALFAAEPLVRLALDVPLHFPVWEYLLFGDRPELGFYLPLDERPYMAVVITTGFWLLVWWTMSRVVRLVVSGHLGRNLQYAHLPENTWEINDGLIEDLVTARGEVEAAEALALKAKAEAEAKKAAEEAEAKVRDAAKTIAEGAPKPAEAGGVLATAVKAGVEGVQRVAAAHGEHQETKTEAEKKKEADKQTPLQLAYKAVFDRHWGPGPGAPQEPSAEVLPKWAVWFGSTSRHEPDRAYLGWAIWLWIAAVPFFLVAWGALEGDPYRVLTSMFSVAFVLWVAFGLNMALRGLQVDGPTVVEEPKPQVRANGWPQVEARLRERHKLVEGPMASAPERNAERLPFSADFPSKPGIISPLLSELLPGVRPKAGDGETHRLTPMQHTMLTTLSRQAFVHVEVKTEATDFALDKDLPEGEETGLRHRNQLVLAEHGAGKTQLALLAAANHAIVHAKSTLIVVRDAAAAEAFEHRCKQLLQPSSLRWNLHVKRAAAESADVLATVVPDVIVATLHELVVQVLDQAGRYQPFLERLGLVILDDVERYCGAVEIHAQLAFRRLRQRMRAMLHLTDDLDPDAPVMLVLGAETMQDMPSWVRAVCGVDLVVRRFDSGNEAMSARESAAMARRGQQAAAADSGPANVQRFYRLKEFRDEGGEQLPLEAIVRSCEALAVPWHDCQAGDDRRTSGAHGLTLREDPVYHTPDPLEACVVIVRGPLPLVQRELKRLRRAGSRFSTLPQVDAAAKADARTVPVQPNVQVASGKETPAGETIILITVIDGDEEMALTELNPRAPLHEAIAALPRAFVRSPCSAIVDSHMASELVNHWMELADVLDVFSNKAVETIGRLAERNLLQVKPWTDVSKELLAYEQKLDVRVLANASERPVNTDPFGEKTVPETQAELPPKVAQVEMSSVRVVGVRDRTSLTKIAEADGGSAELRYYPGHIFSAVQGRFVVVGRVDSEDRSKAAHTLTREGDVLVEPYVGDDLSSPRRKATVMRRPPPVPLTEPGPGEAPPLMTDAGYIDPEPVMMGLAPVYVGLWPVEVTTEHIATYRLGPQGTEIRQRILTSSRDVRRATLRTDALVLLPNPESPKEAASPPRLTRGGARLVAAVMRCLLPSIYRAASTSVEVILHAPSAVDDAAVLGPDEGFFLCDLHEEGNGAARTIFRDGVEVLMRLVRSFLERVLYHDRVLARFDHWGDPQEVVAAFAFDRRDAVATAEASMKRRKDVLTWLDSRLRPEGMQRDAGVFGQIEPGQEAGEGDTWDLGRAWSSRDKRVTDLVWARHVWRLSPMIEVACDVGFARAQVLEALHLKRADDPLKTALADMALRASRAPKAGDGVWGAPIPASTIDANSAAPTVGDASLAGQATQLQQDLNALAIVHFDELKQLGILLHQGFQRVASDPSGIDLVTFIASFVRSIPDLVSASGDLVGTSPVLTLVRREGTEASRALLLAALLHQVGLPSGIFHAPGAKTSFLAGVQLKTEDMVEWGRARAREAFCKVAFATMPPRPDEEGAHEVTYVAVDPSEERPVGAAANGATTGWIFIPLSLAWDRLIWQGDAPEGSPGRRPGGEPRHDASDDDDDDSGDGDALDEEEGES
jgi:hypothetical protein